MQIRNPQYTADGRIDCEVDHPAFGWIPFTADPDDPEEEGRAIHALALAMTPSAYVAPTPDPVAALAAERATMVCSRLQGRLVLGDATCAAIDAIAVDPETPWPMRQAITHAIEWRRMSQTMTELGYLLGYTDTQMDDLFRLAMTVEV